MARRIALTMLALVSVLLITAVAPLGLITAGRERDSFQMATVMSAQTLATVAEKRLSDHGAGPTLVTTLVRASPSTDGVWVFDAADQMVAHIGNAKQESPPVPQETIIYVLRTGRFAVSDGGGELRVTVSVVGTSGGPAAGVLVLARPTGSLDDQLRMLWAWLIAVAAAGLLTAAIVAVLFARWVGRPLSDLDAAARRRCARYPLRDRARAARSAPPRPHVQHHGRAAGDTGPR
jgi:hypothetical protein